MNELKIFNNPEFGKIRTAEIDGEPWFVGRDVAAALGYKETSKAVREHVAEDDKGMSVLDTPGGKQSITVINESGLYALVLSSKLPTAKKYKFYCISDASPAFHKGGHDHENHEGAKRL